MSAKKYVKWIFVVWFLSHLSHGQAQHDNSIRDIAIDTTIVFDDSFEIVKINENIKEFKVEYYPNDSVKSKTELKTICGKNEHYLEYADGSGRYLVIEYGINSIKHGSHFGYHMNGIVAVKGQYENDVKNGIWVLYNLSGIPVSVECWYFGKLEFERSISE